MSRPKQHCLHTRVFAHSTAFALALAFGLAVIPAGPARAQEGGDALGNVLEEVVVTARKREESLKDVPVSISVISSDFINESGIRDQFDLFQLTPGINYGEARDRNGAKAGVRGVQAQNQNPLRQKVSVFIDGMPVLTNIGSMQFAGLERVEVLRGPQSTAFGRATFGGALNYVTADPGDTFNSEVYVGTSNQGRNQFHVGLDGPIADGLGYMLNIYTDEYGGGDGWVSTDGYELGTQQTDFVTGKLKWTPSNNFDMEVTLYSLETDDGPPIEPYLSEAARDACMTYTLPNGRPYIKGDFNCDMSSTVPPGGIPFNHHPETMVDRNEDPLLHTWALANSVLEPGTYVERDRVQAEFNFSTGGGSTLQVLTSYQEETARRWFDNDRTALPPEIAIVTMRNMSAVSLINVATMAGPRTNEEKFVDIRWLSPGDRPVRWLVGASVFDYESFSAQWFGYAGYLLGLEDELQAAWEADPRTSRTRFNSADPWRYRSRDNEVTKNFGVYGSVQWDISDRTTLSVEVRRQEDDNTSLTPDATFNNVAESIQPRVAVTHALDDNWSAYAQYSTGTNPAGVNLPFTDETMAASLAAANAAGHVDYDATTYLTFDEEEVTNFEIGVKGGALDNRLQLAAALYTMKWSDIITGASFGWAGDWNDGFWDPDGTIFTIVGSGMVFINAGEGDLVGLELEGSYRLNENWNFRGGLVMANNKYSDFCDAATAIARFGYEPTHTVAEDGVLFDCVDLSGSKITLGPENTLALSGTYRAPLGSSGWEWSARGGLRWESEIYMDPVNIMTIPPVTEVSGSVNITNDNWEITFFGNNLTDVDTPRSTINLDDDPNICGTSLRCSEFNFRARLRTPREIGARLRYRF